MPPEHHDLPGAALVRAGMEACARGEPSAAGLLVTLARTRLAELGLPIPRIEGWPSEPALALYALLCADPTVDDAYARYNALRRELDSFLAAAEHRVVPQA